MAVKPREGSLVCQQLDQWSKAVNTFIEDENTKLKGGAPSPNIEAAIKVGLAIGNARVAYNFTEVMRLPSDKVDVTVRKQLDEMQDMVDTLQSSNALKIQGLARRSQDLVTSLGMFSWQAQVTDIHPKYVTMNQGQFTVYLTGNFLAGSRGRRELRVFNRSAERLMATANGLAFRVNVPKNLIPDALTNNCRFCFATLDMESYNSKYTNAVVNAKFDIWIGVCPLNVGEITVISNKVNTLVRPFKASSGIVLDPKDFPEGTERKFSVYPTSGWHFNFKTEKKPRVILNGQFDHFLNYDQNSDKKSITFTLKSAPGQRVEGQIEFEETKKEILAEEVSKSVPLQWGQEKIVLKESGEKFRVIKYKSFDGQEFEITGPDKTKPYLKVEEYGDGLKLFAEAPK